MNSWLPEGGANLFQKIKQVCQEAENRGQKLYRLSIGQPTGPALKSARMRAAECVQSNDESWHEYQDNGCLPIPDFARRFVQAHIQTDLESIGDKYDYLPIPGIKPMLGLVQLACLGSNRNTRIMGMTKPGYPVPETQASYLGLKYQPLELSQSNRFLVEFVPISSMGSELIMLNYPHNPSGQIATRDYWRKVCAFCSEYGIRLFNDGAYLALAHTDYCFALADVAHEFPELSWAEAYSASKSIANGTGWRVGAIVGSPDFIGDIRTVKGNTDSGFFAPAAAGALYALENDYEGIDEVRKTYGSRINILTSLLQNQGMELAVKPGAGFFTLWQAPKFAFGREMKDAEQFNTTMIRETGIVGVHFQPYIRYAVCGPVEEWIKEITDAFTQAKVEY